MTDDLTAESGCRKKSEEAHWIQPESQEELLARLADARDLATSERERENLCACAYTEIVRLQRETLALHAAGCAESERAGALKALLAEKRESLPKHRKTLPVVEAIERLNWACTFYCEWYEKGLHGDAGFVAYELVSAIRQSLQSLDSVQPLAEEP